MVTPARLVQFTAAAILLVVAPASAQLYDVTALTSEPTEDDFPSIACGPDGRAYVAWVSHDTTVPGDTIMLREWDGETWRDPESVTGGGEDLYRVEVALTRSRRPVLVWSQNIDGNWDLMASTRSGGAWSESRRLTEDPGPDIHHRLAMDRGGHLWICWQAFRDSSFDILLRRLNGEEEIRITDDPANDWDPDIAINSANRIHIAWDCYRHGSYDVLMRSVDRGALGDILPVAASDRFEAHASIAADAQDRIWVAYDDGGPDWGKDYPGDGGFKAGAWKKETLDRVGELRPGINNMGGLHRVTRVGIRCCDGARLLTPAADFNATLAPPLAEAVEFPTIAIDRADHLWVLFRHNPRENPPKGDRPTRAWVSYARSLEGGKWSDPIAIPNSGGRNQQRMRAAVDLAGGLRLAWADDGRTLAKQASINDNVHTASLRAAGEPPPPVATVVPAVTAADVPKTPHVRHRIVTPRGRLNLYWGDLHRHTEISGDGVWDGSILDMYRYGIDAASIDFIATTDHDFGNSDYHWWYTQKLTDVFHVAGKFAPLFAYERSIPWPIGHRNIINLKRGYKSTPRLKKDGEILKEDTPSLWDKIRGQEVMSIPHTIAAGGGTDWTYHDPALQPLMEIYQGCRLSYEAPGAPKAREKRPNDRFAGGYAWDALAKGYRIGFIAASDHRSTHISFAAVYAENLSREAIFDAMQKRHTYAATENIVVGFRIGDAMMGDEVDVAGPVVLEVDLIGTTALSQIDIIRNNQYIYTRTDDPRERKFRLYDKDAAPGQTYYYYVRVQQADEQIAWSSPIWVTCRG